MSLWGWALFAILVLAAVAFDLGLLSKSRREQRTLSVRAASIRSAGWIGLALLFGIGITALYGRTAGLTYLTAYLLEESLSIHQRLGNATWVGYANLNLGELEHDIGNFAASRQRYAESVRILAEMKPNEPMDLMYLPSTGHMLAMCYKTVDPNRTVLPRCAPCDSHDRIPSVMWMWSRVRRRGGVRHCRTGLDHSCPAQVLAVDLQIAPTEPAITAQARNREAPNKNRAEHSYPLA